MSFLTGLEKEAGVLKRSWNKLKGLVTGKEYLYHGTSSRRAKAMSKQGILPDRVGGVSKIQADFGKYLPKAKDLVGMTKSHKGLTFASREPDVAREYARRQEIMDKLKRGAARLRMLESEHGHKLPKPIRRALQNALHGDLSRNFRPVARKMIADKSANSPLLKHLLPQGHTFEIEMSKKEFNKVNRSNPYTKHIEQRFNRALKESRSISKKSRVGGIMTGLHARLMRHAEHSFNKHDVALKGKIDPKYLKNKK